MNNINLEVGNIHIWSGSVGQVMVSYEDTKKLLAFKSVDAAVNGLWLVGDKEAARKLNQSIK